MSYLAAFAVTPLGVGEEVGQVVAEAIRVVRESGLPNHTTAIATIIEGDDWDQIMDVIHRATRAVTAQAPRVIVDIKIDYRPGTSDAITGKVATVERYLSTSTSDS